MSHDLFGYLVWSVGSAFVTFATGVALGAATSYAYDLRVRRALRRRAS